MTHVNTETLNSLKSIMADDFSLLIDTYLKDSHRRIQDLSELIGSEDNELLRRIVHSFKGSSLNLGAEQLASICNDIELRATNGLANNLDADLASIKTEFLAVENQLKSMILN